MKEPTFSIITPTRNRDGRYERGALTRCITSVENQTYNHDLFEHILVDDGNPEPITVTNLFANQVIVRHEEPTERYIAYNDGMKAAKNDWIVFLDDDDEYVPYYLEYLAEAIKKNPKFKVFNYGGMVLFKKDPSMKARPVVEFEQKIGAEVQSGDIVNGQFAFHKSCLKKSGMMPNTTSLWEAYDTCGIPGYGSAEGMRPLGNPYGQDFYLFYKLTRHYISKPMELFLYICHWRGAE